MLVPEPMWAVVLARVAMVSPGPNRTYWPARGLGGAVVFGGQGGHLAVEGLTCLMSWLGRVVCLVFVESCGRVW